jgi:hypothetical protein
MALHRKTDRAADVAPPLMPSGTWSSLSVAILRPARSRSRAGAEPPSPGLGGERGKETAHVADGKPRRRAGILLAILLTACSPTETPTTSNTSTIPPTDLDMRSDHVDIDRDNLLNIASGAALVSRTAEMDLESSAVSAMDGMQNTRWSTPSWGPSQTAVYSLGAPSRVERLGITTYAPETEVPDQVRFDASLDGTNWSEVLALPARKSNDEQAAAVKPFDARYLRVRTVAAPEKRMTHLSSVHVYGRETAAPASPQFDGCWTVNTRPSRIVQNGGDQPTYLDGSVEGRVGRVMWTRGYVWGYGVLTLSPDRRQLTGLTFFQNPLTGYVGPSWIGERCSAAPAFTAVSPEVFLQKAGHWSVDEASAPEIAKLVVSKPGQRFRVTAYEYREKTPEESRRRAETRLASLRTALQQHGADLTRIELVPAARPIPKTELDFAVQRILWSRMDLAVAPR